MLFISFYLKFLFFVSVNQVPIDMRHLSGARDIETQLVNEMRMSLFSYLCVIQKRICDDIPMIIKYFILFLIRILFTV